MLFLIVNIESKLIRDGFHREDINKAFKKFVLKLDANDKIKDYNYLSNEGLLMYLLKYSNFFDGIVKYMLKKESSKESEKSETETEDSKSSHDPKTLETDDMPEDLLMDRILGIMYGMSTKNNLISISQLFAFLGDELKEIQKLKAIFSIINKNIIFEEETAILLRNLNLNVQFALNLMRIC